jgi:hypothetical protein
MTGAPSVYKGRDSGGGLVAMVAAATTVGAAAVARIGSGEWVKTSSKELARENFISHGLLLLLLIFPPLYLYLSCL